MKVSKVNHMKEAIINNRGNIEGTLYNSLQGKKTQKADIEVHVRKLAESGQRLYNVLNQKSGYLEQLEKQGNRALARTAKDVISNLNKAFKSIIKKTSSTLGEWRKREIDTFEANLVLEKDEWICKCKKDDKKKKIDWKNADKKEFVHQIILYHLRKSLQKNIKIDEKEKYVKISEVVEQLAYALCCEEGKRVWTGISEDEMKILVAVLKEDYLKTEQIRQIAKSIQNQNVRVQVSKQGNKKLLQLSSADNEKKKHLFEFMKCYAAGGWNERRELLLKIRKLILFYVAGIEEFDEILPLWSWGAYAEEILLEHPWFSVQAAGLTEKRDDLDCKEKTAKREINNQIREELRRENMKRYKRCIESEELSVETAAKCKYWAGFVSKTLENLILNETMVKEYKLSALYLCDKVWENFLSYIAMKYVNMGKAVYHFAFPDFTKAQEDIVIGEILPQFFEGITSFDYERITAEEDLERELSSYVLFGVNNFSRTIASAEEYEKSDKFSDVLQINKKNMVIDSEKADHGKLVLYPDVYRRILQFFGGQSQWQDTELGDDSIALVDAMKEKLAFVRNSSFHYASKHDMEKVCENELVQKIFSKEYADLGKSYRKKYYSNNVPRFYSLEDIDEVMDILYNKAKPRVAQVPAFNNIIKKKDSADVMGRIVAKECVRKMHGRFDSKEVSEMFQSTFLFLLKEIYYYQFLQLPNLMFRFEKAIEKMQKSGKSFPVENFSKRMKEIKRANSEITFGEFCQAIMTDYNLQNQNKEVLSGAEKEEKEKYQHFRMVLYSGMKDAFLYYLNTEKKLEFLKKPEFREHVYEELSEAKFCGEWTAKTFADLENMDSELLFAWYITAHFLNPKQLNHLSGCIRNYIQYIENINLRAVKVGERDASEEYREKIELYTKVVRVLEFVMIFCGQISNEQSDYFVVDEENDYEDYANHLSKYVDFLTEPGRGKAENLKMFCESEIKIKNETTKIGIYQDNLNPIMNRNVIMASMYGQESILADCMIPVTKNDLVQYYQLKKELESVFKKNKCENKTEQIKLKQFQNLKNRIELLDVMTYTEIMNELYGKLISWAYLRERDLMYFQLGFHYLRLFYGELKESETWQRTLKGDEISIRDGVLLYQIAAMYRYELPVYTLDTNGAAVKPKNSSSVGAGIKAFYEGYCKKDSSIYESGLCLFEVLTQHDEIVKQRNAIDHFRYYSKTDKSMMDLYFMIYQSFFTYDPKLRKSVSFNFKNILKRYFVIANTEMKKEEESKMTFSKKGLVSDKMYYKLETQKGNGTYKVEIDARSPIFLEQLKKLLEYKK